MGKCLSVGGGQQRPPGLCLPDLDVSPSVDLLSVWSAAPSPVSARLGCTSGKEPGSNNSVKSVLGDVVFSVISGCVGSLLVLTQLFLVMLKNQLLVLSLLGFLPVHMHVPMDSV